MQRFTGILPTGKQRLRTTTWQVSRLFHFIVVQILVSVRIASATVSLDEQAVECVLGGGEVSIENGGGFTSWELHKRAMAYIKQNQVETVPMLRKALNDPSPLVRDRAWLALMSVPDVGVEYVRQGLNLGDPSRRDVALSIGLHEHPEVAQFRELFFGLLSEAKQLEEQRKVLRLGSGLPLTRLSMDRRAYLRAAWQRQAEANPASSFWVMPIVRFGDQQSKDFLQKMASIQSGLPQGGLDYSRLDKMLVCGLGKLGDTDAVRYLAGFIRSQGVTAWRFDVAFDCACDLLSVEGTIQEALLSLLPNSEVLKVLSASVAAHEWTDFVPAEATKLAAIYQAAAALAEALEIPVARDSSGGISLSDISRIREAAAQKLGIKLQ